MIPFEVWLANKKDQEERKKKAKFVAMMGGHRGVPSCLHAIDSCPSHFHESGFFSSLRPAQARSRTRPRRLGLQHTPAKGTPAYDRFMKLGGDFLQGMEDALEDVAKGPSSPGGASDTSITQDEINRIEAMCHNHMHIGNLRAAAAEAECRNIRCLGIEATSSSYSIGATPWTTSCMGETRRR